MSTKTLVGQYKLIGAYTSDEDITAWWRAKYGKAPMVIERTGGGTLVGPVDDVEDTAQLASLL